MTDTTQPKKKRVNGKVKGNTFENTIAKLLTKELQPLNFRRSPGSGAIVGGVNFELVGKMFGQDAMNIFVGDVVCINQSEVGKTFLHSVECKFYKDADNFESFVSGSANLYKWMKESMVDAAKTNKYPILIFKWNRTSNYLAILEKDRQVLLPNNTPNVVISHKDLQISVFYLEDILKIKEFWFK